MKIIKFLPQMIAVFLTMIILAIVINTPLGVADGGGQYQTVRKLGLFYISAPTNDYFTSQYAINKNIELKSSNTFESFVKMAKQLNQNKDFFNVNILAKLYSILLIIAMWIFVRGGRSDKYNWTNFALAGLLVLIFADFGYTTFFNSLYTEGLTLVLFLLCASILLYIHNIKKAPIWTQLILTIVTILFAYIGTLQACIGVIIGLLIARLYSLSNKKLCKYFSLVCGLVVIVVCVNFTLTYKSVDYEKNIYNSVFFGVANYTSVTQLGLDDKFDSLRGQFYTDQIANDYKLDSEFYSKISYPKIIKFYSTNWGASFKQLAIMSQNAFMLRQPYLGNYELSANVEPAKQANGFTIYSFLKKTFIPSTLPAIIIIFGLYFGILIYLYVTEPKNRLILEVLIAPGVMASTCLKFSSILTGGYEISRSLYMFNIMFDLMVIVILIGGARALIERNNKIKEKYGVNQ